jgi:hypothetical protein
MAIRRTTAEKRKQHTAINYRLNNPLIPYDKIVEKFALDMSVGALCIPQVLLKSQAGKRYITLNSTPTPAKALPASEPPAPTPRKYPKGELHDQIMAEASMQLANNWKKYGNKSQKHGPATVIKQFTDKYPDWQGCDRGTLCRKAKKRPGQSKGVRSGVLPASQEG